MRKIILAMASVAAIGLSGCVSTSVAEFDAANFRVATAPESIQIYRTPDDVDGEFREIGLIEANGDLVGVSTRRFYEAIRRRAARMGATGVILEPGINPGATGRFVAGLLDIQAERYVHAIAIVERNRAPALSVDQIPPATPAPPAGGARN